jgi:hypothetical protein
MPKSFHCVPAHAANPRARSSADRTTQYLIPAISKL